MIKRSTIITLEILAVLATALVLACGVLVWRLSEGPLEVASLTRHIESGLSDLSDNVDITVGRTVLQWDGLNNPLAVHVQNVKAHNELGGEIATVSEVVVGLSLPDLFLGQFVPTRLNVIKPSLAVTRDARGQFDINLTRIKKAEEEVQQNIGADPFKGILSLISDPSKQGVAGKLENLSITNAEVFYHDILNDFILKSPSSNIDLVRDDDGILGVMSLNVDINGKLESLRGEIDYIALEKKTEISFNINKFNPASLSSLSENLKSTSYMDVPLTGTVKLSLNELFQVLSFGVVATSDAGVLTIPALYEEPIPVEGANLDVSYNPNDGSLFMKQFAVDIDGFRFDMQGRATQDLENSLLNVDATMALLNIQIDQLPKYWTPLIAPKAHAWVTKNIEKGVVPKAVMDITLSGPLNDLTQLKHQKSSGKILFEGASAHYLRPLPPVINVKGVANFDQDKFSVTVEEGNLRDTHLKETQVDITGLNGGIPTIDINTITEGPLQDGLYLIGHDPLNFTEKLGLDDVDLIGDATTEIHFNFPLLKHLKKEQVELDVKSTIKNLSGEGIITDLPVKSDQLKLSVNKERMTILGKASLGGVNVDLDWLENFDKSTAYRRKMTAKGQVQATDIEKLSGFDIQPFIVSPFMATATIQETRSGEKSTAIELDLKNTAVRLPQIGYEKAAGVDGKTSFEIVDQGAEILIRNLNVSAPQLSLQGGATIGDKKLQSVDLTKVQYDGTDAAVNIVREGERYKIGVTGQSLNVAGLWHDLMKGPKNGTQKEYPSVTLSADVKNLTLVPEQSFGEVKTFIELYPDHVRRMEMNAITGRGDVYIRYTPLEDRPGYQLRAESPDAGAMLKAFGLTSKISGGLMIVDASSDPKDSKRITGGLTITDFKVVKAPVLGRILNALSPVGLIELLNNDGINFVQLQSKWHYKDKVMTFDTGRMAGSSLGLNYSGQINTAANYMDVKGTVVPVDPVNRVVGSLPIVGQILGGLKGEGLFAATYEVKGDTNDPKVTVNPLAALAPGILRSIFFEGGR